MEGRAPPGSSSAVTPSSRRAPTGQPLESTTADGYLGELIGDRYRVDRLLGEGGMGWVFEVTHVEIGKKLALKVMLPHYSRDAVRVARFRREARAAAALGHPNIVDVTDFGVTDGGNVFYVMERLEGGDLGATLDAEHRLAPERAIHIAIQVCRALAVAHEAGIIHRDLKPENVFLITRDGDPDFVKVLDFGIARSSHEARGREEPDVTGTPEYMAPEQVLGRPSDPRLDIYALGAILYEMVTAEPPHGADDDEEVLRRKLAQPPRPVRELEPAVPAPLAALIERCLARDPAARPPSMATLEYELNKCARGRGLAVAAVLGLRERAGSSPSWTPIGTAAVTPDRLANPLPDSLRLADPARETVVSPPPIAALVAAAEALPPIVAPVVAAALPIAVPSPLAAPAVGSVASRSAPVARRGLGLLLALGLLAAAIVAALLFAR